LGDPGRKKGEWRETTNMAYAEAFLARDLLK
jgi:hypothetical protein